MPRPIPAVAPASFTRVGDLLKYLRRRARITQRELSIEVGYSEVHISRFESNQYAPDVSTLLALFVPAFDLQDEPEWVARLLELGAAAQPARQSSTTTSTAASSSEDARASLESIPGPPMHAITRVQLLDRVWARLRTERGVALCALAGMGKTTLAAAIAREHAQVAPVFWLTLTQGVTTSVDALLRQLALFLLAHGQTQVMPLVSRDSAPLVPMVLDQQLNMLGAALTTLARTGQPMLCIDNIHLVHDDAAIKQVLRHVWATTPALLLLMSREDVPLPEIVSLHLDGLELLEGLELIARLGGNLYATLAERLLAKTGGSPMLLRLAIGQLREQPATPERVIAQLEREPHITTYLLHAMLERLELSALRLLTLLAVFRQPLNLYDEQLLELSQAADESYDPAQAVVDIQRRHVIDHPAHARLHPLVRDHLYATLSTDPARKRRLHCVAAEWSELVADDALEAAHHYAQADDLAQAIGVLTEHSPLLRSRGQSYAAAAVVNEVLVRVRRQVNRDDLTRQLLILRADLLIGTLRAAEAETDYRSALAYAAQPGLRAQIVYRLADSLTQRGQAEEAIQLCQTMRAALAPTDTLLQAQLLTAESSAHVGLTANDQAYQTAEAAIALTDQFAVTAPRLAAETRAKAYTTLSSVLRRWQHYDQAREQSQRAISCARQAGLQQLEHRSRLELAHLLIDQNNLEAVIALCEESLPMLEAANDHYAAARLLTITTLSYLSHADLHRALQVAIHGVDVSAGIGDTHGVWSAYLRQARVLIALGRLMEARTILEQGMARLVASGDMSFQAYYLDRLSMVQMVEGDAVGAETTLHHALALRAASKEGKLRGDVDNDLAVARLMRGAITEAAQLVQAELMPKTSLASILERALIRALVLLAQGEHSAAHAGLAAVAARADAAKHFMFSAVARRIQAAGDPPLIDYARLLWVVETTG